MQWNGNDIAAPPQEMHLIRMKGNSGDELPQLKATKSIVKHGPCTMNRVKLGKCSSCQHFQKAILYNLPPIVEDYLTITYENVKTVSSYNATKDI